MNVRYHSPEALSLAQLQWLTNEFKAMNTAIYSSDKTSTAWEEFIDVESMARFFILQEVMDNPDGFHGSFYLHKDLSDNAKWTAGPVWDLSCYHREKTDYTFRMKVHYGFTPHWIGEIMQYDSFCKTVEKVWREVYPYKLTQIYTHIDEVMLPLEEAWKHNCERWNFDPTETAPFLASRIKKIFGAQYGVAESTFTRKQSFFEHSSAIRRNVSANNGIQPPRHPYRNLFNGIRGNKRSEKRHIYHQRQKSTE